MLETGWVRIRDFEGLCLRLGGFLLEIVRVCAEDWLKL